MLMAWDVQNTVTSGMFIIYLHIFTIDYIYIYINMRFCRFNYCRGKLSFEVFGRLLAISWGAATGSCQGTWDFDCWTSERMTMEKQAFEDVSPIKNGDFPLPCWFLKVYIAYHTYIYIYSYSIHRYMNISHLVLSN